MTSEGDRARRDELLAGAAVEPLSGEELLELQRLGNAYDPSYERAAAGMAIALADREPLPASLHERIRLDALRELSGAVPSPDQAPTIAILPQPASVRSNVQLVARAAEERPRESTKRMPRRDSTKWIGWLAAAACLGAAVAAVVFRKPITLPPSLVAMPVPVAVPVVEPTPRAPSPAEARSALLARAKDVVTIEWTATKDAAASGVTGDVVWSNAEQRGFMRFHGAQPNDKLAAAYQLWIFDQDQDPRFPIDGGVFDVDASGDVVVPIVAKLHVSRPTLFAITIEKPGGVVVSKREHIVVTAAVKTG